MVEAIADVFRETYATMVSCFAPRLLCIRDSSKVLNYLKLSDSVDDPHDL